MSSYVRYLEDKINLLEQECKIYKSYIERELGDRIRYEVDSSLKPKPGEGTCKAIIIPEARYAIYVDNPNILF